MVAAVLLGMAEKEIEHIRERQASGIAAAKERGVKHSNNRKINLYFNPKNSYS